jgi:hypothetical protein
VVEDVAPHIENLLGVSPEPVSLEEYKNSAQD